MARKAGTGRKKIDIKKIEQKEARQVAFSKRKLGLFNKASELCVMCGVDASIIIFSPAGKPFTFGHPSVNTVIDRFLAHFSPGTSPTSSITGDNHDDLALMDRGSKLHHQYIELFNQLEGEKKNAERIQEQKKAMKNHVWWDVPIESLSLRELELLRDSMEDLKKKVDARLGEEVTSPSFPPSTFLQMNTLNYNGGHEYTQLSNRPSEQLINPFTPLNHNNFVHHHHLCARPVNHHQQLINPSVPLILLQRNSRMNIPNCSGLVVDGHYFDARHHQQSINPSIPSFLPMNNTLAYNGVHDDQEDRKPGLTNAKMVLPGYGFGRRLH